MALKSQYTQVLKSISSLAVKQSRSELNNNSPVPVKKTNLNLTYTLPQIVSAIIFYKNVLIGLDKKNKFLDL